MKGVLRSAGSIGAAAVVAGLAAVSAPGQGQASSFSYSYSNPYNANADDYIYSTSNVTLYTEGTVRVWIPQTGGATFATTTPGVITYLFDFGADVVEKASLITRNPTFHWGYSQGHNFFYGSKDGATWVNLLDVPPPSYGSANGGVFGGLLPDSLLGGNQLWFKAELYSYGSNVACCGAAGRNTAQHSRWDTSGGPDAKTFSLDVDFRQSQPPSPVPLPASLLFLATSLGGLGFLARWRRGAA